MLEEAKKTRDMKLRRRLLDVAKIANGLAPNQRLSATMLVSEVHGLSPLGMGIEDETHARTLLGELVSLGLLQQFDSRRKRTDARDLDHLEYGITAAGIELLMGARPAHPMVDDERLLEEI